MRWTFGAPPNAILYVLVRQTTTLTLLRVAVGLLCALLMARPMSNLLCAARSTAPAIIVGARFLVTVVSTIGRYFPARRAVRIDPLMVLRSE